MKFTKIESNIIEANDNPWMLGGGISLLAGYFLINLLQEILKPELVPRRIVGLAIGFSLAFLGAAMFWKKSIFRFDIRSQRLIWRRRGLLKKEFGILDFSDITDVTLEAYSSGQRQLPSYRVVLHTTSGDIPMTSSFSGDRKKQYSHVTQILGILGRRAGNVMMRSFKQMVSSGNRMEAIKAARTEYGLTIADAKALIKKIEETEPLGESDKLTSSSSNHP